MLLSRIISKIPNFLYLSSITGSSFHPNIKYCFSNRESSPEQISYFESRSSVYNQHEYPHFKPTITLAKFVEKYAKNKQKDGKDTNDKDEVKGSQLVEESNQMTEKVAGRITSIRKHHKTIFIDIRESHLKLQIALSSSAEKETEFKRGDIIGITGHPFTTKKGELSLNCKSSQDIELLSPCMWMLPEYESLKDIEIRYRNRPLDLLTNPSPIQILQKRSKTIQTLRTLLQSENYIEVETPILSSSCGGAIAKPFVTYHNDHKANLYLRIAPELYLKKLLIGGIQKVFEIGKNFRNESIDQTHNPEFTSCELYCAYEDYKGMIKFTHKLLNSIAQEVNGHSLIKGTNSKGEKVEIDLSKEWKEVDFMSGLENALGMSLPIDFENEQTIKFYDDLCVTNNIECKQPRSIERLLDKLAGRYLETSHEPHIIINHPTVMSPLSQPHPTHPHLTQRFELFINNFEVVNSYTELNNPRIQKINTPNDIDYVEALEYGLMPCAGWGIGIDRFVMLLTGCERIQEVLAFPLLKDLAGSTKETEKKEQL